MNEDKLEKIRKILRLAENNDSPEEVANAMKHAQKLMEKYRISEAMLEENSQEEEEEIEQDILYTDAGVRQAYWKRVIRSALANANGCKVYTVKDKRARVTRIMIVGTPSDISVVRYMYLYLVNEIDRLTAHYSEERGNPGKTACNSFRMGAAEVIFERLKDANEEAREEARLEAGQSFALVRVNAALAKIDKKADLVSEWVSNNVGPMKSVSTKYTLDADAKKKGRQAGQNIDLSGPGRKLGRGSAGALGS